MTDTQKPGVVERAKKFAKDGWNNLISGLNAATTTKKKHTRHYLDSLLPETELESIYAEDGLGARIVDLLPNDMFREGWNYTFPNFEELKAEETAEKYKAFMEQIGAQQKCKEAIKWARLYGGAVILIGVTDGHTPDIPLEPKKIKTFERLRVIDRTDIDFGKIEFQMDPFKERYGLPEYYTIKTAIGNNLEIATRVHHSRIIEVHGTLLPTGAKNLTAEMRYWGLSVLQRADDHLKTMGSSIGSISHLLDEMSIGKYKLKNLAEILSNPEGKETIKRRVELMDLTKSVFRSLYFDSEEDYVREKVDFSGIPEILYVLFMLISADTGYPITRLFGVSPAGMNATGESDMRNYYDAVRADQTDILQPILLRLVNIISQWQKLEEPYIEFVPLETMNESEKADLEKKKADTESVKAGTYKAYIDAGILEPYEARWLEFGNTLDTIPVPEEDKLPPVETIEGEPPVPPVPEGDTTEEEPAPENNPDEIPPEGIEANNKKKKASMEKGNK